MKCPGIYEIASFLIRFFNVFGENSRNFMHQTLDRYVVFEESASFFCEKNYSSKRDDLVTNEWLANLT